MSELLACNTCGQVHQLDPLPPATVAICIRCGSRLERRTRKSLHVTAALSLAALFLYLPANIFPILRMTRMGISSDNTVWSGCVKLFQDKQYGVAIIVFLASIVIPLLKMLGLFILVMMAMKKSHAMQRPRTLLYKMIEGVGRWAMLDVFVVAILVSLVKLQRLATVLAGPGLWAFCAVVVLTLLASASFDPQLIWNDEE